MAERVFPACRRSRRSLFSFPSFFLSLSFLVFPFFCFPFYLPFVPLQVNGDTSVYRFPVRLVYWLFIAVQIYRRSFGTNRNAPGQPEDPIFLTMPVISAPSSRVQLVKTERQRERKSHAINFPVEERYRCFYHDRFSPPSSLFLFLEFKMNYSSFPSFSSSSSSSFRNERKNRLVSFRAPGKFESLCGCDPGKVLEGVCGNREDEGKSLLVEWILMASVIGKM